MSNTSIYHKPSVQKIFACIEKSSLTPDDHARMKDEYSEEELRREEWDKAEKRGIEKGLEMRAKNKALDIARNLLDILDNHRVHERSIIEMIHDPLKNISQE